MKIKKKEDPGQAYTQMNSPEYSSGGKKPEIGNNYATITLESHFPEEVMLGADIGEKLEDRSQLKLKVYESGFTIGRQTESDIMINDPKVSRLHAHVYYDLAREKVMVLDKGSSNGTCLDGIALGYHGKRELHDESRIGMGQGYLRIIF